MDCKELIHPFQKDPGVSQHQRVLDDLLSGSAKIDGRNLADLLDYFVQLSRHINYYDTNLKIKDWQPFFQRSLPFTIVSMVKYDKNKVTDKIDAYNKLFDKKPDKASFQLLFRYIYNAIIKPINTWAEQLQGSGLPIELLLDKLMRDKLSEPLKEFIIRSNAAVKWYHIKPINFNSLFDNGLWDLDITDIYANFDDLVFKAKGNSKRKRLIALRNETLLLVAPFMDTIRQIADTATLSLEQSLFPLKEELTKKHTPHLALLFSFLKLFAYLQGDLNSYTKKHLDFFYKQVLLLKEKDAVPDKAHLVFEIQNQLNKYLLQKGLLTKDGKDNNKAEILFSLDNEIIVNKAQIADQRTLFLNNRIFGNGAYVEGVYMAQDATKADGIDKEFKDDVPLSWPTLGAKYSKYLDPENKFIKPYPNARLGFILASPVLLLNEGTREINITLSCTLSNDLCSTLVPPIPSGKDPCCEGSNFVPPIGTTGANNLPAFFDAQSIYQDVQTLLGQDFYYINRSMVADAIKLGISKDLKDRLNKLLLIRHIKDESERKSKTDKLDHTMCYCASDEPLYEITLTAADFEGMLSADELLLLKAIFKRRKALNVSFSGAKKWIMPNVTPQITLSTLTSNAFTITITASLQPEQEAITFYSADVLLEDLNTTLPVVKVELDDKIKLLEKVTATTRDFCCERAPKETDQTVSLYHFFRNINISGDKKTNIGVKVCGLKNIVVQNDESLQNVNGPIYPFGTRPEVIDFDLKAPLGPPFTTMKNLVGPNFYIGSKEIFGKKWDEVYINLNWKDKPTSFREYYKGYLKDGAQFGLDENKFLINLALLQDGKWNPEKKHGAPATTDVSINNTAYNDRKLFTNDGLSSYCTQANAFAQTIRLKRPFFDGQSAQQFKIDNKALTKYEIGTFDGFIKINLQIQDFCHKVYSYVLARQMMAFGRYPDLINGAIYVQGGVPMVFDMSIFFGNIGPKIIDIASNVLDTAINGILDELIKIIKNKIDSSVNIPLLNSIIQRCKTLLNDIAAIATLTIPALFGGVLDVGTLSPAKQVKVNNAIRDFVSDLFALLNADLTGIEDDLKVAIKSKFDAILATINTGGIFTGLFGDKEVVIPNEPWTPAIKDISIDYTATAGINDIDLIHLYPYPGTYKKENLELQPALFPTFCDEGTLFLGFTTLEPGSNQSILFQLAEATADSEADRTDVQWYYLEGNNWKPLRNGFEVLEDATNGLTTSGIIRFALPANMTNDNTILPKGLHWIKAAIPKSSTSVSETMGIYAQAVRATFTNDIGNDKGRLAQPLPAGSIAKLSIADSAIKKVGQPFDSFGGRMPEANGHFYVRVSELLRHKGRAIQKFDYERLALEAFPQLFKAKCINHSFALDAHKYVNDIPMSPGYVLLAVIPDMNQLKAVGQFEPKVPVSMLEDIQAYLQQRTSPFVRLRVMDPRYEKVNFCLKVKLNPGKDESYYRNKLKQDLKEFMAPWAVGVYDKLAFGQCLDRSDVVRFLEQLDYIDYMIDLRMQHEDNTADIRTSVEKGICPITPRSILIAGNIDICILQQDCEQWDNSTTNPPCANKAVLIEDYCK